MHNFYNLNPNHNTSNSSSYSSITLELNIPLTNEDFHKYLSNYLENPTEELQNTLGAHLNNMHYLLGILPNESSSNDSLTLSVGSELNLLICSNDNREVFLPIFTDDIALKNWYSDPINTLSVSAEWLWKFILRCNNYAGVVINPDTISWCIDLEQLQSLLDDIN